jgi:hypothetical protein
MDETGEVISMASVNPYTMADYERLKSAQGELSNLVQLLDKGERCGVNCGTARAIRDEMERKLQAIEREFMSNPSELG